MQHHRSIGTAILVALMAAHRSAAGPATLWRAPSPPDPRQIDRATEQLWQAPPPASGGERQPLA